ncbi:TetR/AcrR family transcriptional regulator [Rhodococcus globerulus]|uniref:TetR/AcrR family transcriptional regulator n=1 Tax=Rhodococcus globerulus TaxID=33008 RepID=UPI003019D825
MPSDPSVSRVVQMLLSPAQLKARTALIEAAIELATGGGYDAVSMPEVAKRAGMSTAKAYQHIGSKDQLLFEALLTLGDRSAVGVAENQPAGETPADRLIEVLSRIMGQVAQRPLLYRAVYRAYIASAPAIDGAASISGLGPERAVWIARALQAGNTVGFTDDALDAAARVISLTFQGAMVSVAAGRDVEEVAAQLEESVRLLLPLKGV